MCIKVFECFQRAALSLVRSVISLIQVTRLSGAVLFTGQEYGWLFQ